MKPRRIWRAALFLVPGLILQAALARADTVNHCIDSCIDTYNGSNQDELRQNCISNCKNVVNYGAIAYAVSSGVYGYSYDYHSAEEANQRALSDCESQGDGCAVVISFSETCAALAAGDNNRFAAHLGDGVGDARGEALTACKQRGGKNCTIKASTCARD